jgi:phosphonate transport system substrate-binding protein
MLAIVLLTSCGKSSASKTPTPTVTLTPTATFPPTLTPTPQPLGKEENPYVIGLVSETQDPAIQQAGDDLARQIFENSGMLAIAAVFPSYQALLDGMTAGEVHAAWMPPLTYLYASQHGLAEAALLTNHFGVYHYGSQIMANVESNFIPYYDPIAGLSSADAATALAQFQDRRPCWVEPESAAGYIVPAALLLQNEITTPPGVIAQSHTAVVRALYIKGICDFGATYSIIGDPRTGSGVQQDLPDTMNRILIIWRSDAVIPNIGLVFLAGMSEADRQNLSTAFLDVAKTPEGRDLLSLTAGNYQIDDMKVVTDEVYEPLRQMVKALKLNLNEMVGK